MTILYNLRAHDHHYTMTKFDDDLNPVKTYRIDLLSDGRVTCNCEAGSHGRVCRHRKMLPQFLERSRQNTEWMLDYDRAEWRQFVGPAPELPQEPRGYILFSE